MSSPSPMRISFDIDETLVCRRNNVPVEPRRLPWIFHRWLGEPLRRGTRSLVQQLQQRGCGVWIYTTSERTSCQIWLWLFLHGIRVDGVVNAERHRRELSSHRFSRPPSKYPPAFGINLHVDDSEGVRLEGDEHGFRVIIVRPDDEDWAQKVLEAVGRKFEDS